MGARLTTIIAGATLLLSPVAGLAQSSDDGPIATAPDAPRTAQPPPPDQPDQPPPPPAAAYAPQPEAPQPAAAPSPPQPPANDAPPTAAYAAPQAAEAPQQAAAAPPAAVAFAVPSHRVSFVADTASKDAMGGALAFAGAAMAINAEMQAGDKLISADAIDDPASAIAHAVARDFAAAQGGSAADAPTDWDGAGAGWARYFVKVSTTAWGFTYYPLDWRHYHLTYDAKLELVDFASKRVLAKATCSHKPDAASERFTYEDLTGNGGAALKSQLQAIADECAAQFKAELAKS